MRLKGKVALITGGTEGMGFATARLFLKEGAKVVISGRSKEKGKAALKRLHRPLDVIFVPGDVSKPKDARRMVEETVKTFGRIDILFNNAGVYIEKRAEDTSEDEWDRVLDVNLKGTFLVSKFAIPHMIRHGGGSIVNNSSDAGIIGNRSCPAYCASKGGVTVMTKAMALDLAPYDINVNAIGPGVIKNGLSSKGCLADPATAEKIRAGIPLKRFGRPRDIGNAVVFLSSEEANYVTGVIIYVDGGVILASPWS